MCLLVAFACPQGPEAAEFQLNPVRLTLTAQAPIGSFALTNTDTAPVRVQLNLEDWDQSPEDGDIFTPAKQLIGNPPLFSVQPKASQTVRIGLTHPASADVEQAFRAFFQEVPASAADTTGIQTLLRISVPIFVPPAKPAAVALGIPRRRGRGR